MQLGREQGSTALEQVESVESEFIGIAERHIEFAFLVYPVKPIEARAIQVEEPCSALKLVCQTNLCLVECLPNALVMLAGFGLMTRGEQTQFIPERFQIPVLQNFVKPNQIRARITQNGATGLNAEEHRRTSRKRFEPSPGANIMGEQGDDLVCQVGFAPEPFHSGGRVGCGQFEVEQGAHGESMLPRFA